MALTVYAENMGLFHKGSGGKGIAPLDVCLTPPPPPAGPIPIPYVNVCSAKDLSKGSKTVKIDKKPTALEDKSYVSKSIGDNAGTQGGNVINHKIKGKAYFRKWSREVKVEGKGVGRHGDMMGQNASSPDVCFAPFAKVKAAIAKEQKSDSCKDAKYERPDNATAVGKQRKKEIQNSPKCHSCPVTAAKLEKMAKVYNDARLIMGKKPMKGLGKFWLDHKPPLKVVFKEYDGCKMSKQEFKEWARKQADIKPQCFRCSWKQGPRVRNMG
ncbi:hypothetical protein DB30_00989 [Enhygromyxa salina]|uniref:Uncharacterized protein n=1 Tax=Enhygromyxa salina TaxID=215803 RepID=A0A0C2CNN0_9BACT|nr:DUF4150 domain-containing protein [Enhygromyxa salina]KIG12826.1 hypothetical protein DB30_00989 [Enhygromyxa salina]